MVQHPPDTAQLSLLNALGMFLFNFLPRIESFLKIVGFGGCLTSGPELGAPVDGLSVQSAGTGHTLIPTCPHIPQFLPLTTFHHYIPSSS